MKLFMTVLYCIYIYIIFYHFCALFLQLISIHRVLGLRVIWPSNCDTCNRISCKCWKKGRIICLCLRVCWYSSFKILSVWLWMKSGKHLVACLIVLQKTTKYLIHRSQIRTESWTGTACIIFIYFNSFLLC